MAEDIEQELRLAKAARDEWMKRWQFAEGRLAAVWDDALHSARLRIGQHDPKCIMPCVRCWVHDEITAMLRGDANNYITIKERARHEAELMCAEFKRNVAVGMDENADEEAYSQGVYDMLSSVEKMLGDHE